MNPTLTIAELANLCPPTLIEPQFTDECPKHRSETLGRFCSNMTECSGKVRPRTHILDVLGTYNSGDHSIKIFRALIKEAAQHLAISENILSRVVILHEYAHYVTHLGSDSKDRIWAEFAHARITDKEKFAQIYTYLYLGKEGPKEALESFIKLNAHQSNIYQLWKEISDAPLEQVNDALIEARQRGSFDFQIAKTKTGFGIMMAASGGVWIDSTGNIFQASAHEFDPCPQKGPSLGASIGRYEMDQLRVCIESISDLDGLADPPGPGMFMDGSSETFYIKCPSGESIFQASNGDWGKTTSDFDWIMSILNRFEK